MKEDTRQELTNFSAAVGIVGVLGAAMWGGVRMSDMISEEGTFKSVISAEIPYPQKQVLVDTALKIDYFLGEEIRKAKRETSLENVYKNTAVLDFLRIERDPENIVKIAVELAEKGEKDFSSYETAVREKIAEIEEGYVQRQESKRTEKLRLKSDSPVPDTANGSIISR